MFTEVRHLILKVTDKDTIQQIKMDEYYRSYRLIAAYMVLLDRELE